MSKNDRRQEAPANAQDSKPSAMPDFGSLIEAQLAPVGEFRERAESWMKEITAQVARLAGRTEEEDRRKQAIDKRLADFEDRMQSLLTLTELVSIDKNPFAGKPAQGQAPAASPNAPPNTPASAPPTPPPAIDPVQAVSAQEARPAPRQAEAPPAAVRTPSVPQAPRPKAHPNHAAAEPILLSDEDAAQPVPALLRPVAPRLSNGGPPAAPPRTPDAVARHRLTLLEWSRLLAPQLGRFDLGAFLGFYVEAGWIDRETAACVRNLSQQLRADGWRRSGEGEEGLSLDELHARSILVLSHLDAAPVAADAAGAILREARSATQGGWLTPTA